jgi:type I restriction enzyme S subunit
VIFLAYIIKNSIHKLIALNQGTSIKGFKKKDLSTFKIKLPSLQEQQKTTDMLSLTDREIELLKKELEALKKQKRGLMQKLLTGEVRVKNGI